MAASDDPGPDDLPGAVLSFAALPADQWHSAVRGTLRAVEPFDHFVWSGWHVYYLRRQPLPRPWHEPLPRAVTQEDWQTALPQVLAGVESQWPVYKREQSGVVAFGEVNIGGRSVPIVAKRPARKRASQWVLDLFRPARARRSWIKTWKLIVRGLPTELPLLLMERRIGPSVIENLILFERVAGPMLHDAPLDDLLPPQRRRLLHDVGRVLGRLEALGFAHFDAKAVNWIVFQSGDAAPLPVMLDCDGVRHYRSDGAGLRRLLRSLREHPGFTDADADAVHEGYDAGRQPQGVATDEPG